MVTGHGSRNTICAASGSHPMLNSVTGVRLPRPYAPPMSTTSATRSTIRGSLRAASATLVSGPVGTSVTVPGGCASTVSMIRSTACRGSSASSGSGSTGPSSPDSPWMSPATRASRSSGRAQPAANGTPEIPPTRATASALRVTFSRVWFPATVVTASSSTSGLPWASSSATASSCPGSQSRTILRGTVLENLSEEGAARRGSVVGLPR